MALSLRCPDAVSRRGRQWDLLELAGEGIERFLFDHDVYGVGISPESVPPHAPAVGEAWESTVHHFRCVTCGFDLLLWDAS